MTTVTWLDGPQHHDYPAAASYLTLIAGTDLVDHLIEELRDSRNAAFFKAKDILRAARLALLPVDNPHVSSDLRKIHDHKDLSPILLVRGDLRLGIALEIADGYHRVCASYHTDENTDIPCRIASAA
ncbi:MULTISPECIES: hypothetical protein [unclassified Amycolatopsis]|uniref:hypothetical protein n=1 Tax=unclassified Amycolatopsis TaxID=2618356 RepID=UPI001C697496|nr:hypothetical protein [Amycolatopsis sp. DSM 110486]QYN18768.1 hypothetical protein K1T34_39575 [Amycolatopsis sp. DSM 110486]